MAEQLVSVGALWVKRSKQGAQYMSGIIDGTVIKNQTKVSIVVFKNKFPQGEHSPTHRIYLATPRNVPGAGQQRKQQDDFENPGDDFFGGSDPGGINDPF